MAVIVGYLPTNTATRKVVRYYVCDLESELLAVSGAQAGDFGTVIGRLYLRTVSSWIELTATSSAIGRLVRTNDDTVIIKKGNAVRATTNGVALADPTDKARLAMGIASDDIPVGTPGIIITNGMADIDDWTEALGTQFLTPNTIYFLGSTPGSIVSTPPPNLIGQPLGRSATATAISLNMLDFTGVS